VVCLKSGIRYLKTANPRMTKRITAITIIRILVNALDFAGVCPVPGVVVAVDMGASTTWLKFLIPFWSGYAA
jgi:uncharacterized membrane protein